MSAGSRRKFLRDSIGFGATSAVLGGASASATSGDQVAGANERIRIALIGCGGMGRGDLRDFVKLPGVQCVALCDVDDAQAAVAQKEILDADTVKQKPELVTRDFRRVLDRKDIDAVIVATPDHWHALPTILACQAGKDVYVEKPLSLTIGEGRAMVNAARKHNRVVQMGTQQRSATHFTDAVEYVKSGKLGKSPRRARVGLPRLEGRDPGACPDGDPCRQASTTTCGSGPRPKRPFNPNRFHFNFRWYWDYSGGLMTDWGAHMIDIANWAHGRQGAVLGGLVRRQVRLSRRRDGDARHAAGGVGYPTLHA